MRKLVVPILFLRCILFSFKGFGQIKENHDPDFDKIFKAHGNNTYKLYSTRGIRPEYQSTGNVTLENLTIKLKELYPNNNVGVLIYSYQNDSLIITLLGSNGLDEYKSLKISENELTSIEYELKASFLFSNEFSVIPQKRGATPIRKKVKQSSVSIPKISKFILPFGDSLLKYRHLIIVPALN